MIDGAWRIYGAMPFDRSVGRIHLGRPGRPFHAFIDACRLLPSARAEARRWPVSPAARKLFRQLAAESR